ncbi:MAG TPA: YdjY domain-containing protein [Planctomycetota bacterium]|nr:YdjY domain-containing protein [Planctomycetota bacterium]
MNRLLLTCAALVALAACEKAKPAALPAPTVSKEDPKPATGPTTPPAPPVAFPPLTQEPMPKPPDSKPPPMREDMFPRMQEYVVKPVEGEPVWPSPSEEKEIAAKGYLQFKGGYQYELTNPEGKVTESGVVVDGRIILDRGLIELLGCGEGGKEYESMLRLDADVQGLDLALTLCGLKRGPIPGRLNDPDVMQGSRVIVLLQWVDDAGKTVTHRAEDCIVNIARKAPMPRVGWTYVGAMLPVPDPAATSGKTYRVLAASGSRSLMTTYRDATTLLDNPLFDANDDSLYVANYMVLPSMGTKVRVILRAPDDALKKEIAKLEAELAK